MSIEEDKNKYDSEFKDKDWDDAKKTAFGNLLINALIEIKNKLTTNPTTTMHIEKPTPEDVKKIHNEINQIVNQRFLITTATISIFGVVSALLVRETLNSVLIFFVSFLLSTLIFSLYVFSYFLKRTLRIFTVYLKVTESSVWEKNWKSYRDYEKREENTITWAYSKGHTIVFMLLGVFSIVLPLIITSIKEPKLFQINFTVIGWLIIFFIPNITYLIIEWYIGFRAKWDNEKDLDKKWREVLGLPQVP
jgi:hypothetical protein